jgi:gliding motility-associated lipoprotein GldD
MSKLLRILTFSFFILACLATSCRKNPTPKPRGYYRISFPDKSYRQLDKPLPYSFQIPVYSTVTPDLLNPAEKEWITLEIPANKAQIHISYKKIDNNLAKLIEESRTLVYNHSTKASSIDERIFMSPASKTYGTLYTLKGNAASPMQFYLTDSVKNFIRGALYIKEIPNYDSLQPVINFLSADVIKMIETTKWEGAHGR